VVAGRRWRGDVSLLSFPSLGGLRRTRQYCPRTGRSLVGHAQGCRRIGRRCARVALLASTGRFRTDVRSVTSAAPAVGTPRRWVPSVLWDDYGPWGQWGHGVGSNRWATGFVVGHRRESSGVDDGTHVTGTADTVGSAVATEPSRWARRTPHPVRCSSRRKRVRRNSGHGGVANTGVDAVWAG
jgi:hypothetical protein